MMLIIQSGLTLCDTMDSTRLLSPWDSPGENTGVGCHALFQGIFPAQEWNPHLLSLLASAGRIFTTSATWEAYTFKTPQMKVIL